MDIDVDFETSRRGEVIQHVLDTYDDQSARICSYSEYDVDGLINDLAKVCGLPTDGETDAGDRERNKKEIAEIKRIVHSWGDDNGEVDVERLKSDPAYENKNDEYDNILKHFCLLYKKVRNLGTHAAGVAVTSGRIEDYACQVRRKSGKDVYYSTCYDLNDLETINCIKFDMLGLQTLSESRELRELSGYRVQEDDLADAKIYTFFREGKTEGIFQMEKSTPKKILSMIQCSNENDVIAVNALNRPAPLQLHMHETFAHNKLSGEIDKNNPYYEYTKETYGTMLYQEQTVEVAKGLGHLSDNQSFDLLKIMKKASNLSKPEYVPVIEEMRKDFFKGCKSEGLTKEQTKDIWSSMLIYGFNKGHSVGYGRISIKQMYYKVYYPVIFWYVKIKYARNDADFYKFTRAAILDDFVVFLPHVNYSALTSLRREDGEQVIQQGLVTIKGIGEGAAKEIEEERKVNGCFKSKDDFIVRCKGWKVNKRVIEALETSGALQFNKEKYLHCVIKYNSVMAVRR